MKKYIPSEIEPKWQQKWAEDNLYFTDLFEAKNGYYVLVELAYTSGDLHIGHWFTFTMGDVLARFKRMEGYNVVYPNGFDAFGLPAENAAIKNKIHPRDWTYNNVSRMTDQFKTMGSTIDWTKTMVACDPEYYKWNQWIFLKLYEKGLAYKGKMLSNWCPNCQTVLANENVEAGKCWRCNTEVIQKEVSQWFFKITEYADRLIWPNPSADGPEVDWPKPLRDAQNSWIGKSEGVLISFDSQAGKLEVFTTRPDTIFGVSFMVISPEHPLLTKLTTDEKKDVVGAYVNEAKKKLEQERKENKQKTGIFTGSYVSNPLNKEKIPVWVADYVLPGYGTGAVMGVPSHDERDFEFAKKFGLEVKKVIEGGDEHQAYTGEGVMVNSGQYDGLQSSEAREKISDYIEKNNLGRRQVQYHLHDWSISRQRYWGTPIPIINCLKCGVIPVLEKDLPVELPYEVDYAPKGKPPLATAEDWVNVKCPNCQGPAKRETETMDTFIDSSWYFFRYLDPKNGKQIFNKDIVNDWMPVNIYIGGAEHTLGHALYSRFITKFFKDLGLIDFDEYALKRIHHGVILGADGARMSKSKGNVINPNHQVKEYGADAVRTYLCFLGPFDIVTPWNPGGINGVYHFLQRVWGLQEKLTSDNGQLTSEDLKIMHKTIKKVSLDIENIKFNTAIAALMEWLNYLSRKDQVSMEEYKTLLILLAPFAPHITEELWSMINQSSVVSRQSSESLTADSEAGLKTDSWSIHQQSWPQFDNKYLESEEVEIVVQVNGKVRDTITIRKDIVKSREMVEKMALEREKIKKFIAGKKTMKTIYVPGKIINLCF